MGPHDGWRHEGVGEGRGRSGQARERRSGSQSSLPAAPRRMSGCMLQAPVRWRGSGSSCGNKTAHGRRFGPCWASLPLGPPITHHERAGRTNPDWPSRRPGIDTAYEVVYPDDVSSHDMRFRLLILTRWPRLARGWVSRLRSKKRKRIEPALSQRGGRQNGGGTGYGGYRCPG